MIVIYAEKGDMAQKIAAALDEITLSNGNKVSYNQLEKFETAIKKQQNSDGYLDIIFHGEECKVLWGFGHLCGLKQAADYDASFKKWTNIPLPFFPDPIEIKFNETDNKFLNDRNKKQYATAKKFFPKARYIINATDNDREGEVIFAYLYEHLNCTTPVKRAALSSTTQSGIIEAFDNLIERSERVNIEKAGKTRGVADWLVGANLTAAITLANSNSGVLSVGRVQTPTLNLIVSRELEITNFSSKDYFTIDAIFTTTKSDEFKATHISERFDDKAVADSILKKVSGKKGKIVDIKKNKHKKDVPQLYNLSVLQMTANGKYGFTLQKTLDLAQSLYDGGYTTYPRTNSRYLNKDKESDIYDILDKLASLPEYTRLISGKPKTIGNKRNFFDDSKVTSHYAIIPTGKLPTSLQPDEMKIYDLIAKSVIRMIYPEAEVENTEVVTDVAGENFISKGTMIVFKGWMEVDDAQKEDILPDYLTIGDILSGVYELNAKKTKPPKRYTDKSLLAAMCAAGKTLDNAELKKILSNERVNGIGTEATRAGILETLIKRGYVERKGKQLYATQKGISLIKALPIEDFKSAEMTAKWEQRLLEIELGNENAEDFISDIKNATTKWIAKINSDASGVISGKSTEAVGKCPSCGADIIKYKWGYGCSGYKKNNCQFSINNTIAGKKITQKIVKDLLTKGVTSKITGFTGKSGKSFEAKLCIEDGKVVFKF